MTALILENLTKTYPNGITALKNICLEVKKGDFFALLGPNGAGKSTTIGIITSLVKKTSGVVKIFNYDLERESFLAKLSVGLVPQEFNFNIFEKIFDIIVNQAGYYGVSSHVAKPRAKYLLEKLRLWDYRDQQALQLSGGLKRRLMIARALVHQPKLLILDEPTAGVDIEIRRSMWDFLRELNEAGTTIILTTHYLEEAENLCNNIAIIDRGIVIEAMHKKSLLDKLSFETLLLYTEKPLEKAPFSDHFTMQLVDTHTIEVELKKTQSLNELFGILSKQSITITSMKNKANRLEELFLRLTHQARYESN